MKKPLFILLFTISLFHTSLFSQWFKQTIPVNKPISGIKFIDSLKGWACTNISTLGDTSFIINTTNGGLDWNIQYTAPNVFFNSLSAVNSSIVYVGGYDGGNNIYMLLKTTNGGLNWVNKNPPSVPSDLFFVNQDSGWYCDDFSNADVRTTTNGGATWQLRNSSLNSNCYRVYFLNYSTGWVASSFTLFKTTDAGINWVSKGTFIDGIVSICFINENTGWLGSTNRRIYNTMNGGLNWVEQENPQYFGTINEIVMLNNLLGYAGSRNQRIYKTSNGGLLWGYQQDSAGSYRISFIDTLKGWSGDFGIAHTTNSGGPIIYVGLVNINNNIPGAYKLCQNYPNPFNSQTNIKFSITKRSVVAIKIFDILGREKTIWQSGKLLDAGTHELQFDAGSFASGVYFYSITVSDESGSTRFKETRKMVLIK